MINKTKLICIVNRNENLATVFYPFLDNPLNTDRDFKNLISLNEREDNWKSIQNQAYPLILNLKKRYRGFFHRTYFVQEPYLAYSTTSTLGKDIDIIKIADKPETTNAMFYLGQESEANQINLNNLIDNIRDTFTNALYLHAVKQVKQKKVLAYSHRFVGWQTTTFKLDQEFKIKIITNFGYGRSSYFNLLITYQDIHLTPFSNLILYPFANLESLIQSTRSYPVLYESFSPCYKFVCEVYNEFKVSKEGFILKHIVKELDNLVNGLEKFIYSFEVDFYDFNTAFLNPINRSIDKKVFEIVEANLFRTQKAIDAITLIPSIQKLNKLILVKPYLDRIDAYVKEVLSQNQSTFNQLEAEILSHWQQIQHQAETESLKINKNFKKTLFFIKKYDLCSKSERPNNFNFSDEVELIFRVFGFLHTRYFQIFNLLMKSITDPKFEITYGHCMIEMTSIIKNFPEFKNYQFQIIELISKNLQNLSLEPQTSHLNMIKEIEANKLVIDHMETETWPIFMVAVTNLNIILRNNFKPFLNSETQLLLYKVDVLINNLSSYETFIREYYDYLKRKKIFSDLKHNHRLMKSIGFPIQTLIQNLSLYELKIKVKNIIYPNMLVTNLEEFSSEFKRVEKLFDYTEKYEQLFKSYLKKITEAISLTEMTQMLIHKISNN